MHVEGNGARAAAQLAKSWSWLAPAMVTLALLAGCEGPVYVRISSALGDGGFPSEAGVGQTGGAGSGGRVAVPIGSGGSSSGAGGRVELASGGATGAGTGGAGSASTGGSPVSRTGGVIGTSTGGVAATQTGGAMAVGTGGRGGGTGGVASTGGVPSTGGRGVATGGTSSTGGTGIATGGAANTGGAVGTGGRGTGGSAVISGRYDFEASTQGWTNATGTPAFTSIVRSTAQRFAGSSSLAASITATALATYQLAVTPTPAIAAGATVTFRVFFPAASQIEWVQPYAMEGGPTYRWTGTAISTVDLNAAAWNTLTVTIPATATSVAVIGVQFRVSAAWTGTVYVDQVTW